MTKQEEILKFYSRPGPMTSPGQYAGALEQLPDDVESLVRTVQGLIIHEFVASRFTAWPFLTGAGASRTSGRLSR